MAWDDVVVDGTTVDYAADHNEQTNQIKARLTGSLGAATPNNFIIVNAAGTGATPTNVPADLLELAKLGTPTLKTLQDWEDGTQSGGRIYGGVITDATGGLISVSAMKGMIKIADWTQGTQVPTKSKFFDYAGDTSWGGSGVGTTLTDNSINYIYIDYNSGTPKLLCTTDRSGIRKTDQFNLGRVFKNGTDIEVLSSGINLYNRTRLVHERWIDTFGGISRASGIIPSVSTTIGASPAWSLGVMYAGSNRIDIPAVNCASGGGGTFSSYYTSDSGSTWTEVTVQVRIDWTKYNDITTGLASIGVSKYGVHWMYVCPEGEMYFLYGKGSYTLAQAQAATVATPIPNYLSQWCLLAAKVIISQAGSLVSVTPAWSTTFPIQIAGNHSDLGGLDYASAGHTGFAMNPISDYIKLDPMGSMVPVTTPAGVDQVETDTNDNNYVYGNFTQAGDGANELQWKVIMPEDWVTAGNITAKFHWTVATGTAGHTVKWELFGIQLAEGDPIDTACPSIGSVEDAITVAGDVHISAAMTAAPITGNASPVVLFKVQRIASSGTETTSDARLLGVSIKFSRTLA